MKQPPMTPTAATIQDARVARIELEIPVDAPVERVWATLLEEPDAWWVSDLRCVPGPSRVELEPQAGGHLVERGEEGGSLLWFTVTAVEPLRSLNLAGTLSPPFGGPCQTCLLIRLEADGEGTLMRMTYSMHGLVDEAQLPEMESGWRLLFEQGLKRVAEGR